MKRFAVFTLVAAIAGGAYAQGPITSVFNTRVYTFEAAVKNTNVKTIQVRMPITITAPKSVRTMPVDVKYIENTRLYGYVIDGSADPVNDSSDMWAVIANARYRPAIGHLFYVTPVEMKMFDPAGGLFGAVARTKATVQKTKLFDYTFGAEGGFILNQGEDWEGDNVLGDPFGSYESVNEDYLFGKYDTAGSAWLFGVGFGTAQAVVAVDDEDMVFDFDLNLTGSIIGGWRDNAWGGEVDWQFCGSSDWETEDIFGAFGGEGESDMFRMSSWIAGTFRLTHIEEKNERVTLKPIFDPWDGTYGPSYTAAALKKINRYQFLDDSEDYEQYP